MLPLASLVATLALQATAAAPRYELSAGPAGDLVRSLAPDLRPAELPALAERAWEQPSTWERWAGLLSAEAGDAPPDPARRAELARLALAQGRWDDAWTRFVECAASPAHAAALLPRFLPGAAGTSLEDGAVLAPALPPSSAVGGPAASLMQGRVERRAMRVEGLRVGGAVLAVRVSVEAEGVQIDVEHLSGEAASVAIVIPRDPRFDFAEEYVDWWRQDTKGVAHELHIVPGDEPHTLYARFEPRLPAWPTRLPETVPAQIEVGGIRLLAAADDPGRALLESVAASLRTGPLRLEASVREPHASPAAVSGTVVDLSDAAERPAKLAWIAAAVERRALADALPGRSHPR